MFLFAYFRLLQMRETYLFYFAAPRRAQIVMPVPLLEDIDTVAFSLYTISPLCFFTVYTLFNAVIVDIITDREVLYS